MLPGPVFNFELFALARRGRYHVFRFLYGGFLLLLVWLNDPAMNGGYDVSDIHQMSIQEAASLGRTIFGWYVAAQVAVVLLFTPSLVAGVIAEERQRKTLHYLLSSRLSSVEIVLGKVAARLLHLAVFSAIGLPVVVMLGFFGGVDPDEVVLFFGASATTVFFLASLSAAISVHAKKPRDAVSLAYLTELIWLIVPAFASLIISSQGGRWVTFNGYFQPVNAWFRASSPVYLLPVVGVPVPFLHNVFWMMGLQVGYGAALLAYAVLRLRPVFRNEGEKASRTARALRKPVFRFFRRPACGDDPMIWKEVHVARTSNAVRLASVSIFLCVAGLMGYFASDFGKPAFRELLAFGYGSAGPDSARSSYNTFLRTVLTLIYCAIALGTASAAANGLTSEREQDTWVSLIATPLSALEIVRGKMAGALWSARWAAVLWFLFAFSGVLLGAVHPFGFAAASLATAVYVVFACALGTFFSLRARTSSRALIATVGTLIFVNWAYLLVFIPFRVESAFLFIGVTPMVTPLSLMSYDDVRWIVTGGQAESADRAGEMIVVCVFSVIVYAAAALVLAVTTFGTFDEVNDRPSLEGGERKIRPMTRELQDLEADPVLAPAESATDAPAG